MAPQPRARKLEQAIWTYKNSVELRGFEPLTPRCERDPYRRLMSLTLTRYLLEQQNRTV